MITRYDFIMDVATFFREVKPFLDSKKIKYSSRQSSVYSVLVKLYEV